MSYLAEISRSNPTAFLFLIDQSGSMDDPMPGRGRKKADGVADAVNNLIQNLVIKCSKSEGVRDYFHVGVIGYGTYVGPAFSGALASKEIAPIKNIADSPARIEDRTRKVEDGAGGLVDQVIKFPIWFDPVASGGTPMFQALVLAHQILSHWLDEHQNCFPPTVIHITDGEATDQPADIPEAMRKLTSLSSVDGNVLLFNVHLSSNPNAKEIQFPSNSEMLPDQYARTLFNNASTLTPFMLSVAAKDYGLQIPEGARGFVLNASLELVIAALDIGTRPANLR